MTKHIIDFKRGFMVVKLDMERPVEQLSLPTIDDQNQSGG